MWKLKLKASSSSSSIKVRQFIPSKKNKKHNKSDIKGAKAVQLEIDLKNSQTQIKVKILTSCVKKYC